MLYIGNHTTSSKGYAAMGRQMLQNGGNTFAFFTRNPRGGKAKEINPADVEKFLTLAKEHGFGKLVAHAPYTLNACAAKENLREFARETFADDLRRLELTPGNYYNFHPGSHVGQGKDVGIEKIAEILNQVLTEEQSTTVLLETMAGKGSEMGATFEEIRSIMDKVEKIDKLGVCLDTCHVWDGGYDIVNNLDGVLHEFDSVIGLTNLKAVHLNDSIRTAMQKSVRGRLDLRLLAGWCAILRWRESPLFWRRQMMTKDGHGRLQCSGKHMITEINNF